MSDLKDFLPSPLENPALPETPEVRAAPMGVHAARGAVWTLMQALASKATGIIAQLLLGKLLIGDQFGRAATAFTIVSLITFLPRFFMTEVLVRRQRRFKALVVPAFWLTFAMSLLGALATLVAAGLESLHDLQVAHLMVLLAILWPVDSLSACPFAKLHIDLRFRTISAIAVLGNIVLSAFTILFALRGMGAYALVLPQIVLAVLRLAAGWFLAPVRVNFAMNFSRWRSLFIEGLTLSTGYYFQSITYYGDNFALWLLYPQSVVGLYYFAYALSTQSLQLVGANFGPILLAVLSKLQNEPRRQAEAFLRAARSVNLVLIFFCVLQAAVSEPLLRLLWREKWLAAAPVLQVLSLAMAFAGVSPGAVALIQAQGRFIVLLVYQLIVAVVFIIFVLTAAILGSANGALAVAFAVLLFFALAGPAIVTLGVKRAGIGVGRVVPIYVVPLLVAIAACGIPWALWQFGFSRHTAGLHMPERLVNFLACAMTGIIALPIYALIMRKIWPSDFAAVLAQGQKVFARLRRR